MRYPAVMPRIKPSDLVDTEELAQLLGISTSYLRAARAQPERHRRTDGLPEPIRMVSSRPVWNRADIDRWLAKRTATA